MLCNLHIKKCTEELKITQLSKLIIIVAMKESGNNEWIEITNVIVVTNDKYAWHSNLVSLELYNWTRNPTLCFQLSNSESNHSVDCTRLNNIALVIVVIQTCKADVNHYNCLSLHMIPTNQHIQLGYFDVSREQRTPRNVWIN